MRIRPIFAWFDFWVGLFWDQKKRWLYILPIPCFGVVLQFSLQEEKKVNTKRKTQWE